MSSICNWSGTFWPCNNSNSAAVILTVSLTLLVASINGQSPVFLVHPVSTAAVDGTTVQFTCTANGTDIIQYRVNGTSASFVYIQMKGFIPDVAELLDDNTMTVRRNLTVSVSSQYNETEILCEAEGDLFDVNSNRAILTEQGPLSSVSDLSYTYIDSSTVNISWSPPFTLFGTDITGYNISVTSNGTVTTNYYFTSNTYFVLLLTDITNSSCDEISITVSGYNGLYGTNNTVSVSKPPSSIMTPVLKIHITSIDDVDVLELNLELNILQACISYPLSSLSIDLLNSSNITVSTVDLTNSVTVNNILNVTNVSVLSPNKYYTARVRVLYSTSNVNYTAISTVRFNTFSIESVTVTNTTDGRVCLECIFSSFSTDTKCTVVLVSSTDSTVQYNETFTRTDGTTAEGCFDVAPGTYFLLNDDNSSIIEVQYPKSNQLSATKIASAVAVLGGVIVIIAIAVLAAIIFKIIRAGYKRYASKRHTGYREVPLIIEATDEKPEAMPSERMSYDNDSTCNKNKHNKTNASRSALDHPRTKRMYPDLTECAANYN